MSHHKVAIKMRAFVSRDKFTKITQIQAEITNIKINRPFDLCSVYLFHFNFTFEKINPNVN